MKTDLSLIKGLHLKDAFKAEDAIQRIKTDSDYLLELFEVSTRSVLFVYDDENAGHSCFIFNTRGLGGDKTLIVDNSNHNPVFLMRIDGVLLKGESKCDCALCFQKEMVFVEFKSKAANKTEMSKMAQYAKCYNQLKHTAESFDNAYCEAGVSFRELFGKIHAIAVFNPTVPSDNATKKILSARFAKEVHIKLSFTNYLKI